MVMHEKNTNWYKCICATL